MIQAHLVVLGVITRVFIRGRQEDQNQKQQMSRCDCRSKRLEGYKKGPQARKCRRPVEAEKDK